VDASCAQLTQSKTPLGILPRQPAAQEEQPVSRYIPPELSPSGQQKEDISWERRVQVCACCAVDFLLGQVEVYIAFGMPVIWLLLSLLLRNQISNRELRTFHSTVRCAARRKQGETERNSVGNAKAWGLSERFALGFLPWPPAISCRKKHLHCMSDQSSRVIDVF
jgi:hypothetical protein